MLRLGNQLESRGIPWLGSIAAAHRGRTGATVVTIASCRCRTGWVLERSHWDWVRPSSPAQDWRRPNRRARTAGHPRRRRRTQEAPVRPTVRKHRPPTITAPRPHPVRRTVRATRPTARAALRLRRPPRHRALRVPLRPPPPLPDSVPDRVTRLVRTVPRNMTRSPRAPGQSPASAASRTKDHRLLPRRRRPTHSLRPVASRIHPAKRSSSRTCSRSLVRPLHR